MGLSWARGSICAVLSDGDYICYEINCWVGGSRGLAYIVAIVTGQSYLIDGYQIKAIVPVSPFPQPPGRIPKTGREQNHNQNQTPPSRSATPHLLLIH